MKIQQTNINFGMALKAPTNEELVNTLGKKTANSFEEIRKPLEELASDVDIFIKPVSEGSTGAHFAHVTIDVKPLNLTSEKQSFFKKLFRFKTKASQLAERRVFAYHEDFAQRIIEKVKGLKTKL